MASFAASIDDWVRQTDERMLAVFQEATQRTVSLAQERIPVDTGYARASIRASLTEMPQIDLQSRGNRNTQYKYDDSSIVATIASAKLDETIYIGWTASYVQFLEYGSSKQAPNGFIGLAVQQWQHTIDQVTMELKSRVG
jgi:HK97 gp10 family phage protein